jgi:Spy/CpxP family protein refolding chaperone
MKRKVMAVTAAFVLSIATLAIVSAQDPSDGGPRPAGHRHGEMGPHHMKNPLDGLSEDLNLTADQKAKVQPIVDQAKPQIRAIHEEAMQKAKTVMDTTLTQIRPLLTPEQQQKLDAMKKAHEDMRSARQEMHEAKQK